jgi:two-component system OmpR family sensor kinase
MAAAAMVVAGGTAYAIQRERTLVAVDDRLAAVASDAAQIVADSAPTTVADALSALVQRLRPTTNEAAFGLMDGATAFVPSGATIVHPEEDPGFVARIAAETSDGGTIRGTAGTASGSLRYVAVPVSVAGDPATGAFVMVVDLAAELRPVDETFLTFALVALVSLAVVGLVGWFVAGRLLAPIRRLRDTADSITATDASERIEVVGSDDVSELTVTVNGMLDRLDDALTGQRRLLDDVGHELKTPITIVRGHLELMEPGDAAEVDATRALAIDELDRMSGLVRDISDLATLQRPLTVVRKPVDVAALTESVRTKASALSKAHEWTTPEAAEIVADLDADRLTQAWLQLAANAVAHGSLDGTIEVSSLVEGDRLLFRIRDQGPGIDPDQLPTIFERFRRGGAGRGPAGSGLGLAIVAAIAQAHGGLARAESEPGHGATFTIDLPWGSG